MEVCLSSEILLDFELSFSRKVFHCRLSLFALHYIAKGYFGFSGTKHALILYGVSTAHSSDE